MGTLRRIIHEALLDEEAANHAWPGQPQAKNVLSPDINSREQLGAISAKAIDTVNDEDGLPEHLREPQVKPSDCWGPVPPDSDPVHVSADPFSRDYSPLPTGNIKR